MSSPILRWKLNDILTDERISVYALNQRLVEAGQGVSRTTLYRLTNEQPKRINLGVTGRVLWGLEQLTGQHYAVNDLLEYEPMDEQNAADDDRAWLDADLSRLGEIELYEWGEGEADEGEPLRFVPGQGLLIGE